jgi:hypothetical protein
MRKIQVFDEQTMKLRAKVEHPTGLKFPEFLLVFILLLLLFLFFYFFWNVKASRQAPDHR